MRKKLTIYLTLLYFLLFQQGFYSYGQNEIAFTKYHNYNEVQNALKSLANTNPANTELHKIAVSPGGKDITILEIGKNVKNKPAIFVGANFEGITPLSTEGTLYLANLILSSEEFTKNVKWYILPLPNPDASENYFSSAVYEKTTNDQKLNKDVDDQVDEDGFEDLNGDGFITQMRVKDPQGTYIISPNDARIMARADAKKGERGEYKIYSEGIDNDGDGTYNEDEPGGINVGINFPHLFDHKNKDAGLYAGTAPESFAIMKFIYNHPEITMIQTMGTSDFCIAPPKGGRRGGANFQSIKIPKRYASQFGADPNKSYTMDEIIAFVKPMIPEGIEVTPSMIAGFLGLGAAVNPQDDDLKFYTKLSEDYKEYLKEKNFNTERLEPPRDKDGSFELWAYYHIGVPSFSINLFTVPKAKEEAKGEEGLSLEEVEKMDVDKFVALGEEKITAFLKANNTPENFSAKSIIEMMNAGKVDPKQMVGMMKKMPKPEKEGELSEKDKSLLAYIDQNLNGNGFAAWEKYQHPTLGEVEIGGYHPFLESTPPASMIDSLCSAQVPWLIKLSEKLPEIKIMQEKVTNMGSGIYKLELFIENKGYLPYPISMGERNSQPAPVIIVLEGNELEFLEGYSRTPLGSIGSNQVKKLTWIIKAGNTRSITAKIESKNVGSDVKQIQIGG